MTNVNQYDPLLGWRLADNLTGGIATLDYGIRKNGAETEIRKGGILAVGDSFTAGSEVADHESWPAHLERLLGEPVLNGATGGWGVDQIVLRIETLIPLVDPRLILLGILDQDITRCCYSHGGKPKPYFMVADGELSLRHNPVPLTLAGQTLTVTPAVDDAAFWADWGRDGVTTGADPVDIACRLAKRLRNATDLPIIMVMQYGGYVVSRLAAPPDHAETVMRCAEALEMPVIDEFPSLRSIYHAQGSIDDFYVMHGPGAFGHMSSKGNAHIAGLIADRLSAEGLRCTDSS